VSEAATGAVLLVAGLCLAAPGAQETARQAARKTSTALTCAADLGTGIASRRRFCDVVIAASPAESIAVTIPAHTGPATLRFDLHNRFPVPGESGDAGDAFDRQTAVVAVIRQTGEIIDRAAVMRSYRSAADLFDRIAGTGRGSPPKAIAPGEPIPVAVEIPAGVARLGIVGTRLEEWRSAGQAAFDSPGRPVAILSNLRVDYIPREP
jgi:hypothetical protein